jgi:hypothetical protein
MVVWFHTQESFNLICDGTLEIKSVSTSTLTMNIEYLRHDVLHGVLHGHDVCRDHGYWYRWWCDSDGRDARPLGVHDGHGRSARIEAQHIGTLVERSRPSSSDVDEVLRSLVSGYRWLRRQHWA